MLVGFHVSNEEAVISSYRQQVSCFQRMVRLFLTSFGLYRNFTTFIHF